MKIVVCIKQVPDTKGGVKFNPDGTLDRAAMLTIMNPDDKAGLEAALRLKDQYGAEVTVLTMGLPKAEDVLREAIAMGADNGILVTDRVLGGADTWATSTTIAGALRNIDYDTKIILQGDGEGMDLDKDWLFFNPKIGANYKIPAGKIFLSAAIAQREPNRDDLFANPETQPEKLYNFETGIEKTFGNFSFTTNLYYMNYVNQLVLNGQINNVGEFVRVNSGKSYRMGIEVGALAKLSEKWNVSGNFTLSKNENKNFKNETSTGIEHLGNTPISFSPNVIGNILVNFSPTKNFSLGIQNQYVGRQFLDNTNDKNLRLPDYFLADFNTKYTLSLKRTEVDFKFLLNNIFNKKYLNNGFVDNKDPYYFSQAGINFMFGVSLLFK